MSETTTDTGDPADGDGTPSIDEDERADIDLSGIDPEEIEESSGRSDDVDPSSSETDGDQDDGAGEGGPPTAGGDDRVTSPGEDEMAPLAEANTFGDMYVGLLGVGLEVAVEEHGDGTLDAEDVVDLARGPPVDIGANIDRLLAESGYETGMSPTFAVVVGTLAVCGTVLAVETDLLNDAVGDLLGDLTDSAGADEAPELDS